VVLDGQPDVGEQALDPVDVPGPLADEPVAFAVGLAAIVVLDRGDADDRPDVVLAVPSGTSTGQPADRLRPLSPEQEAGVATPSA
jgi:hypothetical protein